MTVNRFGLSIVVFQLCCATACTPTDFTGFWKVDCSDAFGVQIMTSSGSFYSVSFCGPGGCFKPGSWMPNTTIKGDKLYRVIDANTLEIRNGERWQRYRKCTNETHLVLDYASMKPRKDSTSSVIYKKYYEGLPDYKKNSPFTSNDPDLSSQLDSALKSAVTSKEQCSAVPINQYFPSLDSNICEASDSAKIKEILSKIAPSLDASNLALWKADLDSDGQLELLVGHLTNVKQTEEFSDPYFTLWLMKKDQKTYKVVHVGPFLGGRLHAIKTFGPFRKEKSVFVKFLSCTECHATVYLSAINFGASEDGAPFEFAYSEDHESWEPTIEYNLPGMGHTVDAEVETRIPFSVGPKGPHLIQKFDIEEGKKVEWWVFTCQGLKCDYQMTLGKLPDLYKNHWDKGEKL